MQGKPAVEGRTVGDAIKYDGPWRVYTANQAHGDGYSRTVPVYGCRMGAGILIPSM